MGNSGSTTSSSPPQKYLEICVSNESDIRTDDDDPVYALRVKNYRCKLARPSTVYMIAVRVVGDDTIGTDKSKMHFGLLLENTFTVTGSGTDLKFPYVLIHILGDGLKVRFVRSEEAAYSHIEGLWFMNSSNGWKRAKTGGWTSVIACSTAVSAAKDEVGREFKLRGDIVNLKAGGEVELNPDATNCTICAVRFYCTMEETSVEDKGIEILGRILPQLGLSAELIDAYKKRLSRA